MPCSESPRFQTGTKVTELQPFFNQKQRFQTSEYPLFCQLSGLFVSKECFASQIGQILIKTHQFVIDMATAQIAQQPQTAQPILLSNHQLMYTLFQIIPSQEIIPNIC